MQLFSGFQHTRAVQALQSMLSRNTLNPADIVVRKSAKLNDVREGSSLHWSFSCFYVILVPLEYVPSIPPHSSYVIDIFFVLFKKKEGMQQISSAFLNAQSRLNHRYLLFIWISLTYSNKPAFDSSVALCLRLLIWDLSQRLLRKQTANRLFIS